MHPDLLEVALNHIGETIFDLPADTVDEAYYRNMGYRVSPAREYAQTVAPLISNDDYRPEAFLQELAAAGNEVDTGHVPLLRQFALAHIDDLGADTWNRKVEPYFHMHMEITASMRRGIGRTTGNAVGQGVECEHARRA